MKIKPGIAISTDGLSVEDQRAFVDLCVMNGGKKRIDEYFGRKNFIAWGATTNNIYYCCALDCDHTLVSIDQILSADEPKKEMKMQWKQVSSITTGQRHLGSHRMEPTENLHPGDVYQNKVTGYTYEWSIVEEKSPKELADKGLIAPLAVEKESVVYDFSRTPNSGKNEADNSWYETGSNPPAGIICEKSFASTKDEWSKVFIIGNKSDGSIVYEIIECPNKECIGEIREAHGQYKIHGKWVGEVYAFRPLKTERERAIEEIIEVVSKSDGTFQSAAEILYDAGFRKEGK